MSLRSGPADLGVATATSDGDVGIDPELLRPDPRLEAALTDAGFTRDVVDRPEQQPIGGTAAGDPGAILTPRTVGSMRHRNRPSTRRSWTS